MSSGKRLHCTWDGCPTEIFGDSHLQRHIAEPHVQCEGCERYFTQGGLKSHYQHCERYQRIRRHAKIVAHSRCAGCVSAIHEGQHYLLIPRLVFQTMMPVDYVPVRELPDTEITDIVLCGPECFIIFARRNELIENVFGPMPDTVPAPRERMYEMYVEGTPRWLSLDEAAYTVLDHAHGFGQRVCGLDGKTRQQQDFDRVEIRARARAIMDGK